MRHTILGSATRRSVFEAEGFHRKAVRIEARYENVISMAFVTA
jgi:hypothetical protein